MANVYDHNGRSGRFDFAGLANGNYSIGAGSDTLVATLVFQIEKGSGTISVTPKARSCQVDANVDHDDITFQPIPYVQRNVGGTVSDDTVVSGALTGSGIWKMDITGVEASFEITTTTAVGTLHWKVIEGGAA